MNEFPSANCAKCIVTEISTDNTELLFLFCLNNGLHETYIDFQKAYKHNIFLKNTFNKNLRTVSMLTGN